MIDEKNIDVDWQETRRFLEEKYFSKIRELSKKYDYPCENIAIDFNWVFGLIEKIENQPKTDWIPCEERLPSEIEASIVTLDDGEVCIGVYRTDDKVWYTRRIEGETFYTREHKVIAWTNLPQPYKKEGAE